MRMWIPESPRWLAIHGREAEGEAVVARIERRFRAEGARLKPAAAKAPPFTCVSRATILRLRKASTHSSGATA